jgi:Kef-type K+ transport system membrane component KefB
MVSLAYIMIHVGLEFEIDKKNWKQYGVDYGVAATAAAFPWIFVALYFMFVMSSPDVWGSMKTWKESLLVSRFAAPTSAGVLFSMLAAAGLASTWVFRKARILAIFDDLDTILLMIPLKILMIGMQWQLGIILVVIAILLWVGWKYLHQKRWPSHSNALLLYAFMIALLCEGVYLASLQINDVVPIHLEVLLPAFVLGCVLVHQTYSKEETQKIEKVSAINTSLFMVLVGLSMPAIQQAVPETTDGLKSLSGFGGQWPGWGVIALHVLAVTLISNLGKMFCVLCYKREASLRERFALAVAMFPRGEVGAGVLLIVISFWASGRRG